jgi:hypothetical protein
MNPRTLIDELSRTAASLRASCGRRGGYDSNHAGTHREKLETKPYTTLHRSLRDHRTSRAHPLALGPILSFTTLSIAANGNSRVHNVFRFSEILHFSVAFAITLGFALAANIFHFVMVARLNRAGVRTKLLFLMPKEQFQIYSTYRFMAPRQNWPLWPLYGLCLAVAGMFITFIVLVSHLRT